MMSEALYLLSGIVVPKFVRTDTQIKIAIIFYYPLPSMFCVVKSILQNNIVVLVLRYPLKNRILPPGVIYPTLGTTGLDPE